MGGLPLTDVRDSQNWLLDYTLTGVRCVPSMRDSLLSVGQFWSNADTDCHFGTVRALELPPDADGRRTLLPFIRRGGLFEWHVTRRDSPAAHARTLAIHSSRATSHIQVMSANDAAHYMHHRLHCGGANLKRLTELTSDAPAACGTPHRQFAHPAPKLTWRAWRTPATCTHHHTPDALSMSTWRDPFNHLSVDGGRRYALIIVDDHTRFKAVHMMRHKHGAPTHIRRFLASFAALLNAGRDTPSRVVGTIHSDRRIVPVNSLRNSWPAMVYTPQPVLPTSTN
eukprot:5641531-Pleurochrysis_carterae.AAC.3